jgi:hypothetical protein
LTTTLIEVAQRRAAAATLQEIADDLHVSVEWLELVMSSDAYAVVAFEYERNRQPSAGVVSRGEA